MKLILYFVAQYLPYIKIPVLSSVKQNIYGP